jgi:hypothetical protein
MKVTEFNLENKNGILKDLTGTELSEYNARVKAYEDGALDRALSILREKRNRLLTDTDYLALSDNTISEEMITYRQALRDITNGLTTVADVEAVVFPVKP